MAFGSATPLKIRKMGVPPTEWYSIRNSALREKNEPLEQQPATAHADSRKPSLPSGSFRGLE